MTSPRAGDVPALVAFEARFEPLAMPGLERTADSLRAVLDHSFVRQDPAALAPRGPGPAIDFLAGDRTRAVSLTAQSVRLEVADPPGNHSFRALVEAIVGALWRAGTVSVFGRLGLRKVEELSLPWAGRDATDWDGYVAAELLAPLSLFPAASATPRLTGRLQYELGPDHHLHLSYGALPRPALRVSPTRLRLPRRRTPGGVFMLDVDSYVLADLPLENLPTPELLDRLEKPITELLTRCATDRYRTYRTEEPGLFDDVLDEGPLPAPQIEGER